jgi:hypothetical protein
VKRLPFPRTAGWLLRVACDEQLREEFVTMHEAVQEILKVFLVFGGASRSCGV